MDNNQLKKPILLIGLVLIILLILSFLPTEFKIFGHQTKPVDIISDIKPDNVTSSSDDLLLNNHKNKTTYKGFAFIPNVLLNFSSLNQEKEIGITGNLDQLKYFFESLKNSNKEIIRVAHYGDSAIEGDNISADLRDKLQRKFGGAGVGFLAITSQDVRFRATTTHSFSNNWTSAAIFPDNTKNPKKLPVGINGEIFIPTKGSWINYVTTPKYRKLKEIRTIKLFYTNAKKSNVNYNIDNKENGSIQLVEGAGIQQTAIESKFKASQVKLEFPENEQAYFYGVSLENGNGVYVDNFPLRGNSGVNLNDIEQNILDGFAKHLNYKLIILYFGLNIAGNESTDYSWYEREMIKVINKFKKSYPQTSFLIVSVSDKSTKKGSNFITNPSIPHLVKTQEEIAKKTNVAFWNLFEAMGGMNSMDKWVKANPPLASKDYTHFSSNGSQKVANMLADALINAYEKKSKN